MKNVASRSRQTVLSSSEIRLQQQRRRARGVKKSQTPSTQNTRPMHVVLKRKKSDKYRARRIAVLGAVLVTLLFVSKIVLGFFNVENVSLALSGNVHYTEGQIYDVLGANLENIVTDSETRAAAYLQENLSYIKSARISKNLAKRQLTIQITERSRFARLAYVQQQVGTSARARKKRTDFFLIDGKGYVLESIEPDQFQDRFPLIQEEGKGVLKIGEQIETEATQLGLRVLHIMMLQEPELLSRVKQIDARVPQKIEIQVVPLSMPVWLAADLIEVGVHHIAIFVEQGAHLLLQTEEEPAAENAPKQHPQANTAVVRVQNRDPRQAEDTAYKKQASHRAPFPFRNYKYLDARYEDTLYLGGENR